MDDYLKQAIELVKAQSSVRVMQEEEMVTMIRTLAASLKNLENNPLPEKPSGKKASPASNAANPSNSLPENTSPDTASTPIPTVESGASKAIPPSSANPSSASAVNT